MSSIVDASVKVRDVMSSPVITVKENATIEEAAKIISSHPIGALVVVDDSGKPTGIITERDIVMRVVAKNLLPSKVRVKEVMTTPLVTIEPSMDLREVARKMSRLGVRRLPVMEGGELVGIVSSRDIAAITPELIDILLERAKIEEEEVEEVEEEVLAGTCENCGRWSDGLVERDGKYICEECRAELYPEEEEE